MAENGDDGVMRIGKRCYVSNLAWKTSWQDLKDKFRECGNVVYANVTRGEDGGLCSLRLCSVILITWR
jgi:RNA recognition motif-containing protein